jgi:hypothetical protein
MKWRGVLGAAAAVPVVVLAACSSTDPDKYPSTDSFCSARAAEECQVATKCGNPPDNCKKQRAALCMSEASEATRAARAYVPGNAEDCINRTHGLYLEGTIVPAKKAEVDYACARVFRGTVAVNGACKTDFECAGDNICDKTRCAAKVAKKLNDPCANPGEVCEKGTFCTKDATGLVVCLKKRDKGETCSAPGVSDGVGPCLEALRCTDGVQRCEDRLGVGAACPVGKDECTAEAPYCDDTTRKCVAGAIFAPSATELCKAYGGG